MMVTSYANKEVKIDPRIAEISVGETLTLKAVYQNISNDVDFNNVEWETIDSSIVKINSYGVGNCTIEGVAAGHTQVRIILKLSGEVVYKCMIQVEVTA